MAATLQNTSNINKLILRVTVDTLWTRLEKLKQSVEIEEDMIGNWCHVFRLLRCRLKYRMSIVDSLPLTLLIHFDLQMCVFLFALNFSLSPAQLMDLLGSAEVKTVWREVLARAHKEEGPDYMGLPDVLPLVAVLWKVRSASGEPAAKEGEVEAEVSMDTEEQKVEDEPVIVDEEARTEDGDTMETRGIHFVQDVLNFFLNDKGSYDEFSNNQVRSIMSAITCFVSPLSFFLFLRLFILLFVILFVKFFFLF